MPGINKRTNDYTHGLTYYDRCPKAVLAAIAVSVLTCGGDHLDKGAARVLREWWALYDAGIVSQRPCEPCPAEEDPTEN